MSYLDMLESLPERWNLDQLGGTRINLMRDGVVTLVGIKRLESEALFVSSEGGGTLRETAKVEFAGQERYWWINRKIGGVLRRVLLSHLKTEDCTVDQPCANCEVCSLLGALNTTSSTAFFSRVKMQDLISVQPYAYDEKFRVRLPDDPTKPDANPTPFQEVVVPPGTEFPFIVRIIKPSRRDIALFLLGNQIADGIGYGNYSKVRGDATTRWLVLANGFLHISVNDLLEQVREQSLQVRKQSLEDAIVTATDTPSGVKAEQIVRGAELERCIKDLIDSVSR